MRIAVVGFTLCFLLDISSSYTIVNENGLDGGSYNIVNENGLGQNRCPLADRQAVQECSSPRDPCCYVEPKLNDRGCFLGCTTICHTGTDPKKCNTCPDPQIDRCLPNPPNCELLFVSISSIDSPYSCFQRCSLDCY